ncbi:MAG: hypothetical protein E7018_01550 [Alphaproteobacteria bacterium]|nr:hypothetical protein [Alphaproteobacteria bacterium]
MLFKFVQFVFIALFLVGCSDASQSGAASQAPQIRSDKIYYFYQTSCPHCHHALAYIKQKHPSLNIEKINIANKAGFDKFLRCAQKFHLTDGNLGTPLFCMGDRYIMGWSTENQAKFDEYAKPFQ